jgi:thiamine biosynthesis lipoprotein
MRTVERFGAMGTWVEVRADTGDGHAAVRALFESAEQQCSRFRESSELSRVNAVDTEAVDLSPELAAIFAAAQQMAARTGGLVDPAVGGRVIDWGYDRTFSEIDGASASPGQEWDGTRWRLDGQTIHRPIGTRLDLGGIAKGWAADRAVESGLAAVVSAGGDVRSNDPATTVDVVDPWGDTAAQLQLGVGGLATSSISRRRWMSADGPAHHIIDPRTGNPAATPIVATTVIADTAVEAEAGAKAVLILGTEGLAWAARQPWIRSAVAVWHDGNVFATPGVEVAA